MRAKKLIARLAAVSLITGLSCNISGESVAAATVGNAAGTKQIDILTFNDFHGNVLESGKNVGAAKLTSVIKEYQLNDDNSSEYGVLTVSGGDNYQGSALSNLTEGEPVSAMLKEIGIEASAIGNHEYDWGSDKISSWAADGGFDFVAANVVYEGTEDIVDYAEPYVLAEADGVKVAFIGIATPETLSSTKAENVQGIEFLDPVETLDKWSQEVRDDGADIVIALTHCGASNDENGNVVGEAADIARDAADIDAVVAAHNHAFVKGKVNGRPVVQAGYYGRGLGVISFTLNPDNTIADSSSDYRKLYEETITPDAGMEAIINGYNDKLSPLLAEKVTDLNFDLSHNRYDGVTPLGVTVSEAMRAIGGTQVGIANGGGIRDSLSAGDLTVGDMYTILPFDNQLVTLELTGEDLKAVIEHGINPPSFGWGQFAGLKVWYDQNTDEVIKMELEDGTEIVDDEYYTVTTIDFLLTGGDYYDFSKAINVVDTCEVMREGIQEYWRNNGIAELDYDLLVAVDGTEIPGDEDNDENGSEDNNPGSGDDNTGAGDDNSGTGNDNSGSIGDQGGSVDKDNEAEIIIEENKSDIADGNGEKDETVKGDKLPATGAPISSSVVVILSVLVITLGAVIYKNKEEIA